MRSRLLSCLLCVALVALAACGSEEKPAEPPKAADRPLAKAMKAKADAFAEKVPAEVATLFAGASKELAASGVLAKALNVGGEMPAISFQGAEGETVTLAELRKTGPVVLAFYRGKW